MRYFIYCRKSTEAEDRQVASIESHLTTLKRMFGERPDVEIVRIFEEAYSAKAPGRPVFSEMVAEIEKGAAEGIVAWAPDRLARNSVDGGRIIYLLDTGVIKDLKFSTYTFENNSQGKFMLQIMFGQSKYYSDALSENVKRGNRTKLEKGWRPNHAPLGYHNDPLTRTIVKDTERFDLIRRMFDEALAGTPVSSIRTMANEEWNFRTPMRKRVGGKPITLGWVYKVLRNPFYAGNYLRPQSARTAQHYTDFDSTRQNRDHALRREVLCAACSTNPKGCAIKGRQFHDFWKWPLFNTWDQLQQLIAPRSYGDMFRMFERTYCQRGSCATYAVMLEAARKLTESEWDVA